MNNTKAIVLHLDKCDELREKLNLIGCIHTIWYLQRITGVDLVIHSVHHQGEMFANKDMGVKKFIELGDNVEIPIKFYSPYYSRLYSFINPEIQKYDEVIMFDNDFMVKDFNELQRLIDIQLDDSSYGIGQTYVNNLEMTCSWFGFLKTNMKLIRNQISEEKLQSAFLDFEHNKWTNYEECIFMELVRRFGGDITNFSSCPYCHYSPNAHGKCLVHYGWSKSLSEKIRLALDIISNHEFICWVEKIGLLDEFNKLAKFVIDTIMNRYKKLFEATDGKF